MISFTKNKLPFGWLGNMSAHPVEYQGKTWRTVEALFQALRFDDEAVQEEIRAEKSPMAAKFTAKRHAAKIVVTPLSEQDLANMELGIRLKIAQNPGLKEQLLATGDELLVEDVTARQGGNNLFWGMALAPTGWHGKNVLGNLWMKIRGELNAEGSQDTLSQEQRELPGGNRGRPDAPHVP